MISLSIGCTIGLGHYYTSQSNSYTQFYKRPTNYGDDALSQVYLSALHSGADILIGAGFTHENVIAKLSESKSYQNEAFVGIDVNYLGNHGQNVSVANFKTEQSGFLTAIATAEYLNQNQDFFITNQSPFLSFAMWGGLPVPSVNTYLAGFQQGISFFNKIILKELNKNNVLTNENKQYQKIYMTCAPKFYSDGFDPNNGDTIIENLIFGNTKMYDIETNQLIKENVIPSAIFAVAGPQTETLVTKVYNENKNITVIGVDTEMENDKATNREYRLKKLPNLNNKTYNKIIPFSAIKNIKEAVTKILNNIYNGVTKPENITDFGGVGWSSIATINNNGVGISQNGYQDLINICIKSKLINQDKYEAVKNYFSTTYDINNQNILIPTIKYWENGKINVKDFKTYDNSKWLLNSNQDLNEFIKENNAFSKYISDKLKNTNNNEITRTIKMILPTPNSVLFDNSFSENVYYGLYDYFANFKIFIPLPKKQ